MRLLVFLFFIKLSASCFGQEADSLTINEYVYKRDDISLKGMRVLKYWGASNLVIGGIGSFTAEGTAQYFSQMNAFWGGANLLIGVLAAKSFKNKASRYELNNLQLEQRRIEKTFLINTGLDVIYVGVGVGMLDYANREGVQQDRMEGYAYAVILQGAFLLAFDATLYYLHKRNRKKRLEPLRKLQNYYGD